MRRARIRFCLLLGSDPCIKLFLLCLDYGVDTGCIQCIQEFRYGGFGIDRTTDQARNILVVNICNGAHLSGNAGSVKHKAKERAALRFLVVLQLQLDIGNICANRLVLQTLGADNAGAECCGITNGSSILSIGVCPVVSVRLYIVNALFAIQEGIDEVFIRPQAVNHLHGCFRHLAGAGNAKVNVNGSGIKVEIVQNFALQVVTGGQAQHCTGRIAAVSVNGGEAAARSDLYFFYRTDSDELLTALSNRPSTGSSYFWNQYLMLPPTQPANTWFSVTCNGETWLMCYYNVSQVRVGAAVRAKTLLQSLYADTGLVQDSGFALAGLDGTIVYSSQPDLMACGTSLAGHIPASLIVESHTVPEVGTLLLFRPSSDLLHQLSGSFGWLLLLNLLALALITTMLLNTNRHITVPIQQLTEGVREVERGNWDYQLETSSQIEDFQQLFRGFNHMILEVHDLKISAYEAELERHRNELRYLQLQIRPHFYLNAITTISSLIYQDRKQDARSFIDFLSDYLRYLFSGSDTQVTLQQETKHCKSFIQLQQIKYPDTIFYMFELASGTENIRIPKFLLQTVVENIFKHGFSPEQFLSIFLESALEEQNGVRGLRMTVEDNGCGFSPEMLASFPVKEDNGHVGLSNLYHTLQLIYGPAASLHISNAEPNGARVTIFLPEEENHAHPSRG